MKKIAIVTLLLAGTVFATSASAVQMFDFDAQALVPAAPGDALACGLIVGGSAVATPLPLDFANYEYTIVVSSLPVLVAGTTSTFGDGIVTIYQDDTTAADWSNPASFSDGT
ncbi:MAG TPA: hypothetical protein PLQ13_11310, partial [Candidatus Krumholzibacteria bacterium]|nr:hypothetical protein [Candidatus Krumholzibacteria bacterium]